MTKLKSFLLKRVILESADFIMKTKLIHYYYQIRRMEKWSKEEIDRWQQENLKSLIQNAYNNTDYYRELFNEIGISPNDIKTKDDLIKIPLLTKDNLIKNYSNLISKKIKSIPHKISATGGSSGDPMIYLLDNRSWSFSSAHYILNWEKTNYKFGDKHIALGSTSLYVDKSISFKHRLFYKLKNKIGLSGINMSDEVCEKYIQLINIKKIRYIYGYASSIFLLAKFVIKNNKQLNILACFPTSEILTDVYRETIKNAFNCKIVDCYGAHDGGITAFAHEKNNFEVGYNTIIRINRAKEGTSLKGPILLTDLLNYAMPLINYQIGDQVKIKENHNKYNGQLIEKVYGRTSDILILENGNILTGPAFSVLFKDLPVKAYRIVKNGKNTLLCTVVRRSEYENKDERTIIATLKKHAGNDAIVSIEYVEKIELSGSGKSKYFLIK